jgi:micrococcal nuclease
MKALLILLLCLPTWVSAETGHRKAAKKNLQHTLKTIDSHYPFKSSTSRVNSVIDGDTVVLEDKRRLQLTSIYAPEVKSYSKIAEGSSQKWLAEQLINHKVFLEFDRKKINKSDKISAYVFTENNEFVNLQLVKKGLAFVKIEPPNLRYAAALIEAQNEAEQFRRGLWQLPEFAPITVEAAVLAEHLSGDSPRLGFMKPNNHLWSRVVGKVISIQRTHKTISLVFSDRFSARLDKEWQFLFPNLETYINQYVEIRGRVIGTPKKAVMPILHPSAIIIIR